MTDVSKVLNRELGIANSMDAMGKKWGLRCNPQTSLYHVVLIDDEEFKEPKVYPKGSGLDSRFTKVVLGEAAIKSWVRASWDYSDAQAQKKARARPQEDKVA